MNVKVSNMDMWWWWSPTTLYRVRSLVCLLCLPSSPTSLLFLLSHSLSFLRLLLLLPLKVNNPKTYSFSLFCVCLFCWTTCRIMCVPDGKANSSKSVKLRENWRQRSKPVPPGGTYPAKDHCRFQPTRSFSHTLFFICVFIYLFI